MLFNDTRPYSTSSCTATGVPITPPLPCTRRCHLRGRRRLSSSACCTLRMPPGWPHPRFCACFPSPRSVLDESWRASTQCLYRSVFICEGSGPREGSGSRELRITARTFDIVRAVLGQDGPCVELCGAVRAVLTRDPKTIYIRRKQSTSTEHNLHPPSTIYIRQVQSTSAEHNLHRICPPTFM